MKSHLALPGAGPFLRKPLPTLSPLFCFQGAQTWLAHQTLPLPPSLPLVSLVCMVPRPCVPTSLGPPPSNGPHGAYLQLFKPLKNVSRITFLLTPCQAPPDATNKEDAVLSKCQFRGMPFSSGSDYGFYSFTLSPSS